MQLLYNVISFRRRPDSQMIDHHCTLESRGYSVKATNKDPSFISTTRAHDYAYS